MSDARWAVHGERPDTLVLFYSIEDGPLAEIVCYGDVDPTQVAAALNGAATGRGPTAVMSNGARWMRQSGRFGYWVPGNGEVAWIEKATIQGCNDETLARAIADAETTVNILREYLAGNRIVNGHWYSPDECGEPHNINQPATPDELALIETLRTEAGP